MSAVTILLVDDHVFFRRTLRRFLEEQAALAVEVVAEAADGVQACELSQRMRPQVVLMDVQMPRRNGVEACQEIKRDRPEAKVILYTMHDPESYRDQQEIVADACMAKQDLFEQLLPTLGRLRDPASEQVRSAPDDGQPQRDD